MKQKKQLITLFGGLVLALALVAIPLLSAPALDTMPKPIDPQSWKHHRDMSWEDITKPDNVAVDWMTDLKMEGTVRPATIGGGQGKIIGGLLFVDYLDRPFISSQPLHTDELGFYRYKLDGSGLDYETGITKNPMINVPGAIAKEKYGGDITKVTDGDFINWWADYFNKSNTDPTSSNYNRGYTIDRFWRENSYGKWAIDLIPYGVFHIPYFEFETMGYDMGSFQTYNDIPPSFRRGATGTSRGFYLDDTAITFARDAGVPFAELDFFFILHAGYNESGVWQEFGQLQFAERKDMPYELGPGPRMKKVEEFFTKNPEMLPLYVTRYTGHYGEQTFLDNLASYNATKAPGYSGPAFEFKLSQEDWDWVNNYPNITVKNTRYVPFTSWAAAVGEWSHSSTATAAQTGAGKSIRYSTQGENDGMATFSHEYGHVTGIIDNYGDPWSDVASAATEPWELMSRGAFAGPFGDHARWTVPSVEARTVPVHMMTRNKFFQNYYNEGDILELTIQGLAGGTPVVAEVSARHIPLKSEIYPQFPEKNAAGDRFYKGIRLSFGSGAWADQAVLKTTGFSWTRFRANSVHVEVVERASYDTYNHDHGVLLSRVRDQNSNPYQAIIDSHLYDIDMVDYYLDGVPYNYPLAHATQLADATFHAGKSFTDTGNYRGGEYKGDKRASDEIVSGDTVNEFYDAANKLHFYVLQNNMNPFGSGDFLSYTVAFRHDSGQAVGGELTVKLAKVEAETPKKVAVANFDITNTGTATDIIRVKAEGYLTPVLLNDLYAVGAGQTITVPVYVELPADIRTRDLSGKEISLSVSSETNGEKTGSAAVKIDNLIKFNYNVYLDPWKTKYYTGETLFVDVVLDGDANYTQIATEIAYDANLLEFAGYQDLQGWAAAVTKVNPNKVAVRSVPGMNMVVGAPCSPAVSIVTLKFTVKDNYAGDSIGAILSFASILVSPSGGVTGSGTAPGLPVTVDINKLVKPADFDVLDQFAPDSPHAQMFVTEHARHLADFGAAPAGYRRGAGVAGVDRSYVDPHGGEYIMTYVGKEYAGQTYLIGGKPYQVCEHGYAVDPIYEKGGFLFTSLYRDEVNLYVLAMDFDDLRGDNYAPYGAQRSVIPYNGSVYDLTYPQVVYNMTYYGNKGLEALPNHIYAGNAEGKGTMTDGNGVGIVERLNMMSMGRLKVNSVCLNEEYAKLHPDMDDVNDKWPWFRAESAMMSYCTQGPAECEDYRQFSRIHQGGIDAAMRALEKLGADVLAGKWTDAQIQAGTLYRDKAALAAAINKVIDDFENVDALYSIMPPTTHGYGYGWQAGSGIATAFGYNDQSQVLRDSEYRHEFEARTPGGRMIGGGVFGTMNLIRDFNRQITTWFHEFSHTMGLIDDYAYGNMGTNNGESSSAGSAIWSVMGSGQGTGVDFAAWRKFRFGWLQKDEVFMVLPGDKKKVAVLALGAQGDPGEYDAKLAASLASMGYAPGEVDYIGSRMVVIPKEYRTRDTFGLQGVWDNGWNPNRTAYNWYDWFINQWAGGETHAIKSFPTFYTLESRKQLGVDQYISNAGNGGGIIVSYVANSTGETGHGAGGFKILSGTAPLRENATATWEDQNIGLTVRVLKTGEYFDVVEVEYAAKPQRDAARHVYLGSLTASENYVQPNDTFAVDFDIFTFGGPNTNDGTAAPAAPTRVATPLGVQGGIAGFKMQVEFDAAQFEFVSAGRLPFSYTVDKSQAASGVLVVSATGYEAVDKDTILSLNFKAKANALLGNYSIKGALTDVTLLNWRGEIVKVGGPGFNGTAGGSAVGTMGNGTFGAFHAPNTLSLTSQDIKSTGGKITVGANPTYNVSGRIVCEVPGPLYGLVKQSDGSINSDNFTGVESVVTLYKADGTLVATTKSEFKGYFSFDGVPNGNYYVTAKKPRYDLGTSPEFTVIGANVIIGSNNDGATGKITIAPLMRERYTMSGVIKGGYNSDGSGAVPLEGVDVYIVNIGAAYELMGGPVKTDAQGRFTVTGLESFHPYASIAVSVKGTQYESKYLPQIHLYPHMNKPFFGVTEKLELSLGLNYGESGQDYRYPQGDVQLNAYAGTRRVYLNPGACYNIKLTENVGERNVTLVETQDIRLRMTTKSNQIRYQLRDMDGNPVGGLMSSLGNTNGDDMIRNVAPGEYYIEASRTGYISACTMPFLVHGTRIMLRQSQTGNTMDLVATGSGQTLAGTVINAVTGLPVEGVRIQSLPHSASYGAGVPIFTAANGTFSYLMVNAARDLIFSKQGYATKSVYRAAGAASGLVIELAPLGPTPAPEFVEEAPESVDPEPEGGDAVLLGEDVQDVVEDVGDIKD